MKSSYRHVEQHDQPYVKPVLSSTGFRAETLLKNTPKRQNCQVFETIFVKLTQTNTIPINYHEKIPRQVCISKLKTRHFTWFVANQGSILIKIFTA